jgi:hypothetical protein
MRSLPPNHSNLNIETLILPVPGGPNVYGMADDRLVSFHSTCEAECYTSGYKEAGIASLAYKNTTLATCSCYGNKWPISPFLADYNPILGNLGVVPGGLSPINPYSFQTCGEFSSAFPVQGLMNMACVCKTHPWPFADMSAYEVTL